MDRLDALTKTLEAASELLDWAAQEIVAIPLEPKQANLAIAVNAISGLTDLKLKLYDLRPHLLPLHLQDDIRSASPVYSPGNPLPVAATEELAVLQAILVLEGIAAANRNSHLSQLADEKLPKLRSLLRMT